MGKIRVKDLAQKMGVPEQDLLFKLKSIGVRVDDEENAQIAGRKGLHRLRQD